MGETALIITAVLLMIGILIVSLIPFIPGPLLMWLVGVAFAFLNDFERLPIPALVVMTLFMLAGLTSSLWMPLLGMRAQGGSCWSSLGTLVGGLVGTFFIPVPFCGTLIGAIAGALLFELIHVGDARQAFQAGKSAVQVYLLGLAAEYAMSVLIFATFLLSVWLTS